MSKETRNSIARVRHQVRRELCLLVVRLSSETVCHINTPIIFHILHDVITWRLVYIVGKDECIASVGWKGVHNPSDHSFAPLLCDNVYIASVLLSDSTIVRG